MAWLELHTVLLRHRKLKRLARELSIDPIMAVGHLTTFWSNVLELAEDGNISKWSIEDIAEYSGFKGDCNKFYTALKNEGDGFIDEKDIKAFPQELLEFLTEKVRISKTNKIVLVHDWLDYAGRYLKTKYKSHNPEKLDYILSLYGKTEIKPKLDNGKLSNQSNQSNQSNLNKEVLKILKVYKDLKNYETVPNSFYARNYQRGQELLNELKAVEEVTSAMKWWAEFSEKEGLSWTLETIISKIPDWLKYKATPDILKKWEKK